ncbi:MAG: PqiC family protein [Lentisphaeria bacterium]|nr:PqiC family protein [Lentisphaeria bacterium]
MSMTTLVKPVVRWIWLCGGGLLAFGCAYTAPTAYYTLESGRMAAASSAAAPVIVIESVSVPDYLDNKSVVVRQGPHQLERREFDQWAEPLEDAVARVLRDSFTRALPKAKVALGTDIRRDAVRDYSLNIVVYGFEADRQGAVRFMGRWESGGRGRLFDIAVPATGESSVARMVAGMSQAVDLLADEIAKDILVDAAGREITGR